MSDKKITIEKVSMDAQGKPVKNGEWVYYQEHHPSFYSQFPDDVGECGWICSCCNEFANKNISDDIYFEYDDKPILPYCPNCGAKMNGMCTANFGDEGETTKFVSDVEYIQNIINTKFE